MNNRFSAADVRWQDSASCNGAEVDFTPDVERAEALVFVRRTWCDPCPVRAECLAYALLYHVSGYWGGTSTSERRLLSYRRNRTKCPLKTCGGKALVRTADGYEICLRCGASWTRSKDPEQAEESAV